MAQYQLFDWGTAEHRPWWVKHLWPLAILLLITLGGIIIFFNPSHWLKDRVKGTIISSVGAPVVAAVIQPEEVLKQIAGHEAEISRLKALLPTPTVVVATNRPNPIISQGFDGAAIITFPPGYKGGMANVTGGPVQTGTCDPLDRIARFSWFPPSEKGCQMVSPMGTVIEFLPQE